MCLFASQRGRARIVAPAVSLQPLRYVLLISVRLIQTRTYNKVSPCSHTQGVALQVNKCLGIGLQRGVASLTSSRCRQERKCRLASEQMSRYRSTTRCRLLDLNLATSGLLPGTLDPGTGYQSIKTDRQELEKIDEVSTAVLSLSLKPKRPAIRRL